MARLHRGQLRAQWGQTMNYPSIKTLATLTDTIEDARKMRAILVSTDIETVTALSERARAYVSSCYHRPPLYLVKLYAADEILHTYGVEGWAEKSIAMDYCNTGDTYASTLCFVGKRGERRFRVTSWGDVAERML